MFVRFKQLDTLARRCGRPDEGSEYGACEWIAGGGTRHKGWGPCRRHGGGSKDAERAWAGAMKLAVELDINPMEALLWSVRIAAGRVAQVEQALDFAEWRHDIAGHAKGLGESREERKELRAAAKAAIDAGIAETIVRNRELEGQVLGSALTAALEAAGCTPEQRAKALGAAQRHLMGIAGDQVITGELLGVTYSGQDI